MWKVNGDRDVKLIDIRLGDWGRFNWLRDRLQNWIINPFQDTINYFYNRFLLYVERLEEIGGSIKDYVLRVVSDVKDWVRYLIRSFRQTVVTWVHNLENAIRAKYRDIRNWATSKFSSVYRWFGDRASEIYRFISSKNNDAKNYIKSLIRDVKDYIVTKAKGVIEWVKGEYNEAKKWALEFKRFYSNPYKWLKEKFERIVNLVVESILNSILWFIDKVW